MSFYWRTQITAEDEGRLLRDYLRARVGVSARMLIDLKYKGRILLNGTPVTVRVYLQKNDVLELHLTEEFTPRLEAEDIPLSIVYEDDDLLVVNKPADMLVHPVPPEPTGTLANAICHYWHQAQEIRPVRIITRLDRNTSGLVLVAKHALAQHIYTFRPQMVDKYYLAWTEGKPKPAQGLIEAPIAIDPTNPVRRVVLPGGLGARTEYQTLKSGKVSMLRLRLLTGRTHQIRLHLAHLGYPILGDDQYGKTLPQLNRQALHAHGIRLKHLRTEKELCFVAPLPKELERLSILF